MRKIPLLLSTVTLSLAACGDASFEEASAAREEAIKQSRATKFRLSADAVENEYIVVLHPQQGLSAEVAAEDMAKTYRGRSGRVFRHALKGFVAYMSEADARALAEDPRVKFVEQNGRVQAVGVQTPATWGLDRVDQTDLPLDQTYTYNTAGSGVHAYIIDTGIHLSHQEFTGRIGNGYDAVTSGGTAADCNGHGTHVAGTVGGSTYGVAKEVTLHPVRVLDCGGSGTYEGVIAGVDWVTANHQSPAVANMSLGGGASQAVDDAVTNSIAAGVTYAIAAGNDSGDACTKSPARTPNAITVGSTTNTDARSSFSNFGTCVDIFAPGSDITSAWYTSNSATNTISGTSMAAPHVAGAAALYLGTNPTASAEQVTSVLTNIASLGRVTNPGTGSPNLLLYTASIGNGSGDNTAPTTELTSPASGITVTGSVSLSANASDDVGVTRVSFFVNGAVVGTDTTAPYALTWDTTQGGNGSHAIVAKAYDAGGNVGSSAAVTVTVNNPGIASYSATLKAPSCATPGAYCDTGTLVKGRGTMGPEANAPNTLNNSCADGNSGTYLSDESLERIRVSTLDGSPMAPGKTVKVDVTVNAWSTGSSDYLDIYYTGDASNPSWTFLATLQPSAGGTQVLSATYTLPAGSLQAVRGNFRYNSTVASACSTGSYDDRDDLAFATGGGSGPQAPSASFTSSCSGLSCSFTDTSTDSDGTIASRSWSFGDGSGSTAQNPSKTYSAAGSYTVSLTVTDSQGLTNTRTQTVTVTAPVSISLSVAKRTQGKRRYADLTWSGASANRVDVFRNNARVTTTANDGAHTDTLSAAGTYTYKVCNAGTTTCSANVSVTF
ncbi:S8 family serine peptidase [Hyalangium rubrum]|uniref:S8 family serine peptidase n=1 Tax=Hyalangium rubrum TaxID=3103134 RepID=A0ABU5H7D8_9BACT|nr:S8 family serine peptidase [Hyalangium sp. s54d21]MDY7228794.1 S8 family serine peptidase [Hyalangium sp. s54d21]